MPKAELWRFGELEAGPVEAEVPKLFQAEVNEDLLWRAVRVHLANQRHGTAATKTRGEVSGGGRKPWRQKGTGRARHGSIRSPIWRHGGVTFGPQGVRVRLSLPKKMRRGALRSALSARFREGNLKLIDTLTWARPRTRDGLNLLERLSCPQGTLVVLAPEECRLEVFRTFSNIPGVTCASAATLTPYEVLCHQGLLMTEAAVAALERRLGDG